MTENSHNYNTGVTLETTRTDHTSTRSSVFASGSVSGCCGKRIASLLRRMYAWPLMGYHISVKVRLATVMAQRPSTLKPDLQ